MWHTTLEPDVDRSNQHELNPHRMVADAVKYVHEWRQLLAAVNVKNISHDVRASPVADRFYIVCTIECRYNVVQYNMILQAVL